MICCTNYYYLNIYIFIFTFIILKFTNFENNTNLFNIYYYYKLELIIIKCFIIYR